MNQSHSKAIRYVVAGLGVLALLILIEWFALREPPTPTNEQPAQAVSASPPERPITPLFAPASDAQHEAPASQVIERAETNAAMVYRQAFALYDALSKEQKDIVSNWRTNVDASVEAELCEKIQPICDLMHQAAALTNCDWGIEQPITFDTVLPHLSPCRNIARTAIWSAAHCRTGKPAGAVDDLLAASRLSQKVSQGPVLISYLVDLAIQGLVMDSVAAHASILVGAGDTRLVQIFDDADYDEGLRRAIEQEADISSAEADKLAAMPPEEAMRELRSITNFPDDRKTRLQSIEPMQAVADIRQIAELWRQYARVLGSTETDYRDWVTHLETIRETNPIAEAYLEGIESTLAKTQAMTVRSAMLVAGLAVMQDGPDALQSHLDPATGQPFTYTQTSDGFELQSGYQFLNRPLKLSFK